MTKMAEKLKKYAHDLGVTVIGTALLMALSGAIVLLISCQQRKASSGFYFKIHFI